MAENVTIARPYADAVFDLAKAEDALDGWADALQRLALIVTDEQVEQCMYDPDLEAQSLADLVLGVAGEKNLSAEQCNFVRLLIENDRLEVLPQIQQLFLARKHRAQGVLEADIASAFALDDAVLKTLTDDLAKRFDAKIEARVRIDPDLIGGVRIAVGDDVIDASVRGKLAAMAAALKN